MEAAVVVHCTAPERCEVPDKLAAAELARALVEGRLCACVNVVPGVRSWFRWNGAVDVADEVLLVVKTTRAVVPALREAITRLHPYDVPEILELAVAGGSPAYLQWLQSAVAGG